jgi:hypothetical protein
MIRQRSLRFALVGAMVSAGLSLSPEASSQVPPAPGQPTDAAQPRQPAPAAPSPPPSPYAPTMQAGGLTPPPPMDEKTAQTPSTPTPLTSTEEEDDDDDDDSGRGLSWVWFNAEGGFQHVGLQTFNVDEQNFNAGFIETTATGAAVGAGLGVRLLFITIGARGRLGLLDAWQFFTVGGELGLRFPLGNVEPHFELGGGYAAIGSFSNAVLNNAATSVSIRGFYVRPSAGIDYFITPVFSIGASASWEFTAMTRPGLSTEAIEDIRSSTPAGQQVREDLLSLEGSGYGSAVTITGVLGLHL